MPNPEIIRESVGGVWETNVATGGGGGGGVSEITSTDMSVTITDPTGPTVDLSVSGGSQPGANITVGPFAITFAIADLTYHSLGWTPPANSIVQDILWAVDTVWDTNSTLTIYNGEAGNGFGVGIDLDATTIAPDSLGMVSAASMVAKVAGAAGSDYGLDALMPRVMGATPGEMNVYPNYNGTPSQGAMRLWVVYSVPDAP